MPVIRSSPDFKPMVTRRRLSVVALCAGALWSCDPAAPTESTQPLSVVPLARVLRSIDLSPANQVLRVDLNKAGQRSFKVIAHYNDRSTADVTAAATFALDNATIGTMTGGRFDSATRTTAQADFTQVTARYREGAVTVTATTQLTVAWLRTSGPVPDILLTLPYMSGASSVTLPVGTKVQSLDAFLAVDTTGSMGEQITSIIRGLDTDILPAVQAATGDSFLGVGAVEDFPAGSYGSPSCGVGGDDQPFILLAAMTGDFAAAKLAVAKLMNGSSPRGCGNDLPEGQLEALYQIATGDGNVVSGVVNVPPHHFKGKGGVEFRAGALPVVAVVTDAVFHTIGEPTRTCFGSATDYAGTVAMAAHSRTATTTAVKNVCARVIGVSTVTGAGDECDATKDLLQLATDTGAVIQPQAWDALGRPMGCAAGQCCTGLLGVGEAPNADGMCPLVLKTDRTAGTTTGKQVAAGITQLVGFAPYDVALNKSGTTTTQAGATLPGSKNTADFLSAITAVDGTPPATPSGLKTPVISGSGFTGVTPGSTLRFHFDAKNDILPAGPKPQVVKVRLQALASKCAVLEERDVLIIIPAA